MARKRHARHADYGRFVRQFQEDTEWILDGQPLSHLYKQKKAGDRCSLCWDANSRMPTDPDCPECYGTGFYGGYDYAGLYHVGIVRREKVTTFEEEGYVAFESGIVGFAVHTFPVETGDFLIAPNATQYIENASLYEGVVWRLEVGDRVEDVRFHGEPVRKSFDLDPKDPAHVIYRVSG